MELLNSNSFLQNNKNYEEKLINSPDLLTLSDCKKRVEYLQFISNDEYDSGIFIDKQEEMEFLNRKLVGLVSKSINKKLINQNYNESNIKRFKEMYTKQKQKLNKITACFPSEAIDIILNNSSNPPYTVELKDDSYLHVDSINSEYFDYSQCSEPDNKNDINNNTE